jgi:hypothetical protein
VRHFVHDNSDVSKSWQPAQVVSPVVRSQKICQLTNDVDLQTAVPTASLTQNRFGVSGADLGYPFMHDGRQYFALGDTASGNHNTPGDSLAFTRDVDPEDCLHLQFVADGNRFRPIAAPGVSMGFSRFQRQALAMKAISTFSFGRTTAISVMASSPIRLAMQPFYAPMTMSAPFV